MNQLDFELIGRSEKEERSYNFRTSETAKESAEVDNKRIELFRSRKFYQATGAKVFRLAKLA